ARRENLDVAVAGQMLRDVARVKLGAAVDRLAVPLYDDRDSHWESSAPESVSEGPGEASAAGCSGAGTGSDGCAAAPLRVSRSSLGGGDAGVPLTGAAGAGDPDPDAGPPNAPGITPGPPAPPPRRPRRRRRLRLRWPAPSGDCVAAPCAVCPPDDT